MSGRSKSYEARRQSLHKMAKPNVRARSRLPAPSKPRRTPPPPRYVPPEYVKRTGAEYERIFDGLFEQGVLK